MILYYLMVDWFHDGGFDFDHNAEDVRIMHLVWSRWDGYNL